MELDGKLQNVTAQFNELKQKFDDLSKELHIEKTLHSESCDAWKKAVSLEIGFFVKCIPSACALNHCLSDLNILE